jgi:hypothetical protein
MDELDRLPPELHSLDQAETPYPVEPSRQVRATLEMLRQQHGQPGDRPD